MDYLDASLKYLQLGYSSVIFYIMAATGIFLLLFKPKQAFYFSVFCLAARNFHAAVYTRPTALGSFLNMNDLLLWISVFAMLRCKMVKGRIWAPRILAAIFLFNTFGGIQSFIKYGFGETTLRPVWQAAIFPIMFLVGANIIDDVNIARRFYWAVFFGVVVASLQHIFAIQINLAYAEENYSLLRTISYTCNGGIFLLITSFFNRPLKLKKFALAGWYFGLSFIALSYFLSLTRTIWIGAAASVLTLWFIIAKDIKFHKLLFKIFGLIIFPAIFVSIILSVFLPTLNTKEMLVERLESFTSKEAFDESYETRYLGSQRELKLWRDSPLVIGIGTALPPELQGSSGDDNLEGAFYHVGLTTYLAHYGILGLLVYILFLPLLTIKIAKRIYTKHAFDHIGTFALLAISCSLMDMLTVMSSTHYLIPTGHINALIYGGIWGLSRKINNDNKNENNHV